MRKVSMAVEASNQGSTEKNSTRPIYQSIVRLLETRKTPSQTTTTTTNGAKRERAAADDGRLVNY